MKNNIILLVLHAIVGGMCFSMIEMNYDGGWWQKAATVCTLINFACVIIHAVVICIRIFK